MKSHCKNNYTGKVVVLLIMLLSCYVYAQGMNDSVETNSSSSIQEYQEIATLNNDGKFAESAGESNDCHRKPFNSGSKRNNIGSGILITLGVIGVVSAVVIFERGKGHGLESLDDAFASVGVGLLGGGFLIGGAASFESGVTDVPQEKQTFNRAVIFPTINLERAGAGMNIQVLF